MLDIVQKTSTVHTGYLKNRSIQYIVLHYTAGTSSKKGTARNVAAMFANPNNRAASADFIVDDGEIVQYNGDIANRYTYAVGGAMYSVKYTPLAGMFYQKCKNNNSISIEMCSTKTNTKSLNASDTDWSISASVVDKAVQLTRYLMKKYNVPEERVIMHHQVNGKACPQPWCLNERRLAGWYQFKERIKQTEGGEPDMTEAETRKLFSEMLTEKFDEFGKEIDKKLVAEFAKHTEPVYNDKNDIPTWYRPAFDIVQTGVEGTGNGLELSETMLRIFTILWRTGNLE